MLGRLRGADWKRVYRSPVLLVLSIYVVLLGVLFGGWLSQRNFPELPEQLAAYLITRQSLGRKG